MSASLVGSEMCIRDSAQASPNRGRGEGAARLVGPRGPGHSAEATPSWPCLLYTSDAADDM
eukprot:1095128-Alexandrium_andersonii.AAC.1